MLQMWFRAQSHVVGMGGWAWRVFGRPRHQVLHHARGEVIGPGEAELSAGRLSCCTSGSGNDVCVHDIILFLEFLLADRKQSIGCAACGE